MFFRGVSICVVDEARPNPKRFAGRFFSNGTAAETRPTAPISVASPLLRAHSGKPVRGQVHFAFTAKDRAAVRAFHQAALKAGGKDNGVPGLRPHYHQNYYGAFVLDPDGHNIEAVCHLPE